MKGPVYLYNTGGLTLHLLISAQLGVTMFSSFHSATSKLVIVAKLDQGQYCLKQRDNIIIHLIHWCFVHVIRSECVCMIHARCTISSVILALLSFFSLPQCFLD